MSKKHDDLFKDSVMSFGEHLNELRGVLWRAVLGIVVGVAFGLFFADWVVRFIQSPLEHALQDYYLENTRRELERINPNATPEDLSIVLDRKMIFDRVWVDPHLIATELARNFPGQINSLNLPATEIKASDLPDLPGFEKALHQTNAAAQHVWSRLTDEERRTIDILAETPTPSEAAVAAAVKTINRLLDDRELYSATSFANANANLREQLAKSTDLSTDDLRKANWRLLAATFPREIAAPHPVLIEVMQWKPVTNDPRTRTKSFASQEGFMIWLKAAFIVGLVIASPWVFYQVWSFVAAGLYPHERKYVHVFMPFSLGLFLSGVLVSFFVFKPMLAFFFSFNRSLGIDPEPRISEWMSFVMILPLGFGLAFQLPLVMLFLERIGVLTAQSYLRQWRISVLVIWVIAALVTPADPYSIFLLAGPMMLLFFGGILLCKWWPKNTSRELSTKS
jgi:sec-independent protein translocase protein TatC